MTSSTFREDGGDIVEVVVRGLKLRVLSFGTRLLPLVDILLEI